MLGAGPALPSSVTAAAGSRATALLGAGHGRAAFPQPARSITPTRPPLLRGHEDASAAPRWGQRHHQPTCGLPEGAQHHPSTGARVPGLWGRAGVGDTRLCQQPGSITGRPRQPAWGQEREGSAAGCWLNWNKARRPPRSPAPGTLTPRAGAGSRGRRCRPAPQLLRQSPGGAQQHGPRHGAGRGPQVGAGDPHATLQLGKPNLLEQEFRLIPL